jgi:hypothetical protein
LTFNLPLLYTMRLVDGIFRGAAAIAAVCGGYLVAATILRAARLTADQLPIAGSSLLAQSGQIAAALGSFDGSSACGSSAAQPAS